MSLYSQDFAQVFSELLERSGVSCYQIAAFTGLGQSYLSRLRSGGKRNPSPETLVKITVALTHFSDRITIDDIERVFRSVGRSIRVR